MKLTDLKGIGAVTAAKLAVLGIFEVKELLNALPVNLLDLDAASPAELVQDGDFVLFKILVTSVAKPFKKGRLDVFKAAGEVPNNLDSSKPYKIKLSFYNVSYLARTVKVGVYIRAYGKVIKNARSFELINPVCEEFNPLDTQLRGIKPIYYTRGLLGQGIFSAAIKDALGKYKCQTLIPYEVSKKFALPDLQEAYSEAHFPATLGGAKRARERVYIEETVKRILSYRYIRGQAKRTVFYEKTSLEPILNAFPYELTPSQKIAVEGITQKLLSDKPLSGMLCGDVGSGKTAVAVCAAYFAAMSGKQTCVIAPTEILAAQHFETFSKVLGGLGVRCALLTGSTPVKDKRAALAAVEKGEVSVAIGTHALLSDALVFNALSLAIIDEQHRFGVAQRTKLVSKGANCDILTLSATPIPRSLRLTMFGDVDIFEVERRFENDNISTFVVGEEKRKSMLAYIAKEATENGAQAFIVAPMIEDGEGISKGEAAVELHKEFAKAFPHVTAALLHGKQKAADKAAAVAAFREGDVQVLISTTVIEVGIDVPNASILAVFSAERFGLASLHQLRGRVGRNGAKAYCFLYTEKDGELVRLKTMCEERDGIKVAERDYELRGAGEWLGEKQSGKAAFSPSIAQMKLAREVSECVDITEAIILELREYSEKNNLNRVTLI